MISARLAGRQYIAKMGKKKSKKSQPAKVARDEWPFDGWTVDSGFSGVGRFGKSARKNTKGPN